MNVFFLLGYGVIICNSPCSKHIFVFLLISEQNDQSILGFIPILHFGRMMSCYRIKNNNILFIQVIWFSDKPRNISYIC